MDKNLLKMIPHLQESRNMEPRPGHLYSNTIGNIPGKTYKVQVKNPHLQRNNSIGKKKPGRIISIKDNTNRNKRFAENRKANIKNS